MGGSELDTVLAACQEREERDLELATIRERRELIECGLLFPGERPPAGAVVAVPHFIRYRRGEGVAIEPFLSEGDEPARRQARQRVDCDAACPQLGNREPLGGSGQGSHRVMLLRCEIATFGDPGGREDVETTPGATF